MTQIFNKKSQTTIRKILRKKAHKSIAEKNLWSKINNKQIGHRFRRQYGIGDYVVDFYCPKLRLVIEIDGYNHSTDKEILKDQERQKYVENFGLKVLRYLDSEVINNMDDVLGSILVKVEEKITPPQPSPS